VTGTYDPLLGLLLQPYGGNADAWGALTNSNLSYIAQSLKSISTLSSAGGTVTLSNTDFAPNQTRQIVFRNVSVQASDLAFVLPPHASWGFFVNDGTSGGYTCTLGVSGGVQLTMQYASVTPWYTNGTDTFTLLAPMDKIPSPVGTVNMAGYTMSNLPTPTLSSHAATKGYVDGQVSPTLNSIGAPTGSVNFASQRIINLASPIDPNDGVNLQSMNGAIAAASLSGVSSVSAAPNTVLAGPETGAASATPVFRQLVGADLTASSVVAQIQAGAVSF
jgi:hypothetical protein